MITKITNVRDVANFAKLLIHEEKLSVHPDDDFSEYIFYDNSGEINPKEMTK